MEENNNMTAERSLEIITEQIERSRKEVTRDTGLTLYVSGLCVMGVALFIGICGGASRRSRAAGNGVAGREGSRRARTR
ncbi:MAG: hypothetical protein IKH01_09035, partial [Prevotella sp.]|nr:hypothetical protein [Prevotella sp.]